MKLHVIYLLVGQMKKRIKRIKCKKNKWLRIFFCLCVLDLSIVIFTGCAEQDPFIRRATRAMEALPEEQRELVNVSRHELAGQAFDEYLRDKLDALRELYPDAEIVCYVDGLSASPWIVQVEVTEGLQVSEVPGSDFSPDRFLYLATGENIPEEERVVYEIAGSLSKWNWKDYLKELFCEETVYLGEDAVDSVMFDYSLFRIGEKEVDTPIRFMAVYPFATFQVDEIEFMGSAQGGGPLMRRFLKADTEQEIFQVCSGSLFSDIDIAEMSEKEIADLAVERYPQMMDYRVYLLNLDVESSARIRTLQLEIGENSLHQAVYFSWQGQDYQATIQGTGEKFQWYNRDGLWGRYTNEEDIYRYSSGILWEIMHRAGYAIASGTSWLEQIHSDLPTWVYRHPAYFWERHEDGGTLWQNRVEGSYCLTQDVGTGETFTFRLCPIEPKEKWGDADYRVEVYREGEEIPFAEWNMDTYEEEAPFFEDLNGDGYLDVSFLHSDAQNCTYWHYLWSPSGQQFVEAPEPFDEPWRSYWSNQDQRRTYMTFHSSSDSGFLYGVQWVGEAELEPATSVEYYYNSREDNTVTVDLEIVLDGEWQTVAYDIIDAGIFDAALYYEWAQSVVVWYQDIQADGETCGLYYAQERLYEDDVFTGYEGRLWIVDSEARPTRREDGSWVAKERAHLIKYISIPGDVPYAELAWTKNDSGQEELVIIYEDGREEHLNKEKLFCEK